MAARRRRHFRWRWKRKWPLVLFVLLLLSVGAAVAYHASTGRLPTSLLPGLSPQTGRTNVLLMGTDARAGEPSERTDTMILASVDPAKGQVALLSIPRDTMVDLPGHARDKINDADVYGGPDMAMSVVSGLLGVHIDYYVLTNFNGFKDIVDTLGGLTIDVKSNMYHYDPMDGGVYTINLKKGVQVLDGVKALEFVRFRDDPTGDIARTERQQEFLKALLKKMMQPSSLPKLPALVPEIMRNVQTNLPLNQVLVLARTAADINNLSVVHQTLPGYFETVDGVSYWAVDPDQARQVAAEVLSGRTSGQVVLDTPPGVSESTYAPGGVTPNVYGRPAPSSVGKTTYGQPPASGSVKGTEASRTQGAPGLSVQFRKLPGNGGA